MQLELVIVLDQFDQAYTHFSKSKGALETFMTELAALSRSDPKNFRVIVAVRDDVLADEILGWNGNEKFQLSADSAKAIATFKFEEKEAQEYLTRYGGEVARGWDEQTRKLWVAAACKSGSMLSMNTLIMNPLKLKEAEFVERVNDNQDVWQKGVDFLDGHNRRKAEKTRAELSKLAEERLAADADKTREDLLTVEAKAVA